MVVDFLVNGKHTNGYEFYAPLRVWGPRGTDFDQRLRQIIDVSGEIQTWNVEERKVRPLLSLFYLSAGHSKLQFVFYGDEPSGNVEQDQDNLRV